MRLVPQGGEIERGVGARAGNAEPRLRHRPAAARSYKVKVVPVGERQGLGQAQRANRRGLLRDRERCGRGHEDDELPESSQKWQIAFPWLGSYVARAIAKPSRISLRTKVSLPASSKSPGSSPTTNSGLARANRTASPT